MNNQDQIEAMNNNKSVEIESSNQKTWFKPSRKIYLIALLIITLSVLILYLYLHVTTINKPKQTPSQSTIQQATSSAVPAAIQAPTVNSFSAVVKEVKNKSLLVETQDDLPQTMEIPLNETVTFEAWVNKDGKNKPPTRQSATSSDLKIGQKLDIFKTEVNNSQPIYEITILNN